VKHVTYADKSLLMGDEVADLLVEYAGMVARTGTADTVTVRAMGVEGNDVEATFLLDSGTNLMVETGNSDAATPANDEAIDYLTRHIERLRRGTAAGVFSVDEVEARQDGSTDLM
jgi:hypothetical protein